GRQTDPDQAAFPHRLDQGTGLYDRQYECAALHARERVGATLHDRQSQRSGLHDWQHRNAISDRLHDSEEGGMTDIRQNFSLMAGDDTYVNYGIVPPPVPSIDLTQANMTWAAYPQLRGVADKTQQVLSKTRAAGGIEITDPANYQYRVDLESADTVTLAGNYYYEIVIINPADQNRRSTPTIGTMTVVDTSDPLNVV